MRYAIRALGWATKILWILIIVFSATSVYSALNVRIGFGEPQFFFSDETVIVSIPLFINNTGLYDLSELNITAVVTDYNESLVSTSITFVPLIPRGSSVKTAHNISISLSDVASKIPNYLFNDTLFNVNMSMKLNFAHAIPFQISTNMTIPWGAPLYNFSIGEISYDFYNLTHQIIVIPLSFENHSPYFGVDGTMQVEIYNSNGELVGSEALSLDAPPQSRYYGQVELIVDVSKLTPSGEVHFFFETSVFSFGPVVIPYG
jgi:hypothetical protein